MQRAPEEQRVIAEHPVAVKPMPTRWQKAKRAARIALWSTATLSCSSFGSSAARGAMLVYAAEPAQLAAMSINTLVSTSERLARITARRTLLIRTGVTLSALGFLGAALCARQAYSIYKS